MKERELSGQIIEFNVLISPSIFYLYKKGEKKIKEKKPYQTVNEV
jgi:cellobiose-specific phosphotransferase system component IIB